MARTVLLPICLLFVLGGTGRAGSVPVDVHAFHYELHTRSGESKFAGEITNDVEKVQRRFEVENDGQGRLLRVAVLQGGQKILEDVYQYASGTTNVPCGYTRSEAGKQTGVVEILRDGAGARKRLNFRTVDGHLTHYNLIFYHTDRVEQIDYTPLGGERQRFDNIYSEHDLLTHIVSYFAGDKGSRNETDVDENTGLKTVVARFKKDKLQNSQKLAYDVEGDIVRVDSFTPSGNWLGTDIFSNNLPLKRTYAHSVIGPRREVYYSHDEKRRLLTSKLYLHDRLFCILSYDRYPDGTVTRTLAKGPEGDLWAEYPDNMVTDVDVSTGQPFGRENGIIYKKIPW